MAKKKPKPPAKRPDAAALKRGRENTAKRCQEVAELLAKEAGVTTIEYHASLTGKAWLKSKRIKVPHATTRRRLYVFAHECAHIALGHTGRETSHRQEYESEVWAHESLRRHGIAVPKVETTRAKQYVAHKIHQAVRRGAKSIDPEALEFSRSHWSATVKRWLKDNPGSGKAQPPTGTRKKKTTPNKEVNDVTALITQGADVAKLVTGTGHDDLTKWFNLYLGVEVESGSNTHRAKVLDIQWFLRFFFEDAGGYHCDDWTPGRTKTFKSWIRKQISDKTGKRLAPSTCRRVFDTTKHAAGWIHRQRPFVAGIPFEGIKGPSLEDPTWQGLADLEVRRLKAAAEQLLHLNTRANQMPRRNYAILLVMLDSGVRVFELADLQLDQYHRRTLKNIQRKGDEVTASIPLSKDTCEVLADYLAEERPKGPGPLFQSRARKPLAQQDVDYILRCIAAQANSRLPASENIQVSPHVLRHTALRKWANTKGVPVCQYS